MEKVKRTPAKLPELVAEFNMEVLNKAPNFNIQTVTIVRRCSWWGFMSTSSPSACKFWARLRWCSSRV